MIYLKCIKSLVMEDGCVAFTKGRYYIANKVFVRTIKGIPYRERNELATVNDKNETHIIKNYYSTDLDEFYIEHFTERKGSYGKKDGNNKTYV